MTLFGVDISQIVTDAFTGQLKEASLVRDEELEYDPIQDAYVDSGGNIVEDPEPQTFTTQGIVESYSDQMKAAGLATEEHRRILLLAKPLNTTPKAGDKITIEGNTHTVVGIPERDPVSATWIVKGQL